MKKTEYDTSFNRTFMELKLYLLTFGFLWA